MLLKANMGEAGKRVPTGVMPDWVIWLASFFDPGLKQLIPILGLSNASSNAKARCVRIPLDMLSGAQPPHQRSQLQNRDGGSRSSRCLQLRNCCLGISNRCDSSK